MDDIIIYNDVKGNILRKLRAMQSWEWAAIKFGNDHSKDIEREEKQNAYIEYIAYIIANLPMPD